MAMRVKPDTGEVGLKQRYRVTNWSEYDRALVNRGNLTIWFDEASIRDQWTPAPPVGRGKPGLYSDTAIQTCLTIKGLFQLPYRATEGLIKSLMRLCQLDLPVPDHTHMSRRAAQLSVKIPRRPRKGPTHVVVDSTGLKIFGEGEWKVRQHGVGKRRTWRKIHLAVDETSKDIIGIEVTTTAWGDSEILPGLLDQVEGEVSQVSADGAYDSHGCHAAIAERNARATIPPRDGAVAWGDGHPRDAILQAIEAKGLAGWKNDSGYHRRSIAENMMFRLKQLGDSLYSRTFERQVTEAHVRAAILNTFTYLGMPRSDRVGQIAPAA
ncbi:MAG: IS5 family transposase [Accumulibacter sp.]|uniref:IS5 family transposase n=1 Tax=Accumulibacter sp. TaxID=2053492 RepID=UPI0033149D09